MAAGRKETANKKKDNDMEHAFESDFVNTFIRWDRRQRLLHELAAPEKRYDGISRFCHQAEDLLDRRKIILAGNDLERRPEFITFAAGHEEECYILSPDPGLDGQSLYLADAVRLTAAWPDAVLILGKGFAVVFTEPMKGGRDKYLLAEH